MTDKQRSEQIKMLETSMGNLALASLEIAAKLTQLGAKVETIGEIVKELQKEKGRGIITNTSIN